MKLIIAGSRTFSNVTLKQLKIFMSLFPDLVNCGSMQIVSGTAKGIDRLGEHLAEDSFITCKRFPANWDENGRGAGHMRNKQMAKYADTLLLIWDGTSSGSSNMRSQMVELDKPIYEVILKSTEEPI